MARRGSRSSGGAQLFALLLVAAVVALVVAAGLAVLIVLGLIGLMPPARTWAQTQWLNLSRNRRTPAWVGGAARWAGQHLKLTGALAIVASVIVAVSAANQDPVPASTTGPQASAGQTDAADSPTTAGPVPDVTGQRLDAALLALGRRDVVTQDANESGRSQFDDSNWTVLRQEPAPTAATGTVTLRVLKAAEADWLKANGGRMPNVIGQDYFDLTSTGGRLEPVDELVEVDPAGDTSGTVVKQRPTAGAAFDLSNKIVLTLKAEPLPSYSPEPYPSANLPDPSVPNPDLPGHRPHLPGGGGRGGGGIPGIPGI